MDEDKGLQLAVEELQAASQYFYSIVNMANSTTNVIAEAFQNLLTAYWEWENARAKLTQVITERVLKSWEGTNERDRSTTAADRGSPRKRTSKNSK